MLNKKNKSLLLPQKQVGYKSCKPIKNIFELIAFKRLISKNMVIICKYIQAKEYSSNESKEQIKQIKDKIIKKKIRIPPILVVHIKGIFHVTNPQHARIVLAIKNISYKNMIETKIDRTNISLLIYPYISKDETIKMCNS